MSLAEKWNRYFDEQVPDVTGFEEIRLKAAFYAGAEAMDNISSYDEHMEALAEIDQFKGEKP